jgi:hypothetical protein
MFSIYQLSRYETDDYNEGVPVCIVVAFRAILNLNDLGKMIKEAFAWKAVTGGPFESVLDAAEEGLAVAREASPNLPAHVTGYSMGGTLASLLSIRLAGKLGDRNPGTTVFAPFFSHKNQIAQNLKSYTLKNDQIANNILCRLARRTAGLGSDREVNIFEDKGSHDMGSIKKALTMKARTYKPAGVQGGDPDPDLVVVDVGVDGSDKIPIAVDRDEGSCRFEPRHMSGGSDGTAAIKAAVLVACAVAGTFLSVV